MFVLFKGRLYSLSYHPLKKSSTADFRFFPACAPARGPSSLHRRYLLQDVLFNSTQSLPAAEGSLNTMEWCQLAPNYRQPTLGGFRSYLSGIFVPWPRSVSHVQKACQDLTPYLMQFAFQIPGFIQLIQLIPQADTSVLRFSVFRDRYPVGNTAVVTFCRRFQQYLLENHS